MKQTTKTLLILNMFLFLSCADQTSQKNSNEPTRHQLLLAAEAKLNNYFITLSDWSMLSPLKADQKLKTKESKPVQVSNSMCTTQDFDLTKTPEKIVMQNPAAGVLYPGALIQGEGYLQGPGGLRELPIRKRAPIVIATDLANESNAIRIDKVDYAGYQAAYAALLKSAAEKNLAKPANVSFTQSEASSSEQAALDLGFSVKYMGSSLTGHMRTKNSTKENVFMAVFEQRAFTVSAIAPAQPAGFFSADFSEADLKSQIDSGNVGEKNPPLYVSSVTYGRMLIFTVTSRAQKEDIQGALNGAYNQGLMEVDAKVKAKYQKIMNESTVKVIAFGGDFSQAEALIKTGNLNKYFTKSPSLESFVPMSYVLRNIKDNSIAKVSETTKYSTEECTALPPQSWKVKITIEKILMRYTGASSQGEIYGDLFLNDYKIWSRSRNEYESTKNKSLLQAGTLQKSVIIDLPVTRPRPVNLKATFLDNDDFNDDDVLAVFNEGIGYTADKKDVLQSGKYTTTSHRNVEITYSIERIKPEY